jgi:peptidoglycan/LPS O-acetylase OafA/YrhL
MQGHKLTKGSSFFLDLVRVISVQLVVVGHGISYCAIFPFIQPPFFPYIQNIAVVIFFILSGYLISYSVYRKLNSDPLYSFRSYFIDRFSRIYAALVPALIFVFLLDYLSRSLMPSAYQFTDAFNLKTFTGNLLMLQDYPFLKHLHLKITSFGSARPLWTLAIEWWIYMWFGVMTIKIFRKKTSAMTILLFLFLCIVPLWNLLGGRGDGLTLYWLFGALIMLVYERYHSLQLGAGLRLTMAFVLAALAMLRGIYTMEEYDPIVAFLLAVVIMIGMELCSELRANESRERMVRLLANYAYTLYLVHYSIYDFIVIHFRNEMNNYTLFVTGFIFSNVIALTLGYFAEGKLTVFLKQKLKARFV